MRYARLSTYDILKGTFPELTGIVGKGLLPTFSKVPGFIDHGLLDAGNNKVVAISIWETRDQMNAFKEAKPPEGTVALKSLSVEVFPMVEEP